MASKAKAVAELNVKDDFPVLKRTSHGKPLVYLDSAATSQKPRQVIRAIEDYYARYNANVHRAIYELGEESTREYEGARERIAAFLRASDPKEIVFTRGTTESINAVAYAWGIRGPLKEGDEIVTTILEHHSNTIPWYFVQDHKGVKIKWVDINDDGTLKIEDYDEMITNRTKVVTVAHVSNVLGTISPVKEIAKRAHEVGAICVVDGAQGAPHLPVDVEAMDCDFYTVSGHKMLGPTGSGVLYGKEEMLEKMEPFLGGGEMIREVHKGWAKWNDVPYKFEAGTPNIEGAIGLGVAVDYLNGIGMENVRRHEVELTEYALHELKGVEGLTMFGPMDVSVRGGVISFMLGDIHAHDVASVLDVEGIA
ncbi:MAG: SufS family cysteine desulfurase, partial [Euryarchaeota archaeon]|nr:SufS family cysteine desulfurase [Euryarchaeota archaeon]